ncbi:MAG TPA: class I SAM-dependent methyltransferase [Candidatus Bathyarchaeia archaeon]|nr:class I SAM-dependent methyltransferase [Candidatus Bathyarchaeia archaeon]
MCPLLTEETDNETIYHEIAQEKIPTKWISSEDSILLSLEKAVKPHKNELIIELGCGSGIRTLHLAKKYSLNPVLIDWARNAVSLTRDNARRLSVSCHPVRCDIRHLPFRNEIFDIVWAEGAHEHMLEKDRPQAFSETRRVAKTGARLLIFVPNVLNPFYRIEEVMKDRYHLAELYELSFTRSELEYWIKKSGFTITSGEGLEVFFTLFSYSLFDLNEVAPIIRPLYRIKRFMTRSFHNGKGVSGYAVRNLRKLDRNYLPRHILGHQVGIVAIAN